MLDDLKFIHNRDAADMLGVAEKQYQQLSYVFEDAYQDQIDVDAIVYAGMGGSALPGLISQSWPGYAKPFEVVRGYDLPAYVNERTYVLLASQSGNTEETLSVLAQAQERGAQIAIITGGGELARVAEKQNYPLALLPADGGRCGTLYMLKALITLIDQAGLLSQSDALQQLEDVSLFLRNSVTTLLPTVPVAKNQAKQIALDIIGKSAVIYAGNTLWPVAYKWKIALNENAKHVAWWNQLPESNHNEMTGWSEQPVDKPYAVIDLRSSFDHPRVQQRFALTEKLLSGRRPAPIVVEVQGSTVLEQLLYANMLGDFVSLYTALANNVNPEPLPLVDKFKRQLDN